MEMNIILFSLLVLVIHKKAEAICGYQSCNSIKEDQINIHLVPHSHDDMGYIKTVEQYYYGAQDDLQQAGVQYILDSVVEALQKDSRRRFIQVETGFFWKWWLQQSEETKGIVKNLVNNGQLEFVGGGWSMNDEASTYYQSIIDQMTWGLRQLNETFGECGRPRVGWQIDPFGHSREMANIFAQMGYDGIFINRIDYQDLAARTKNQSLEFIWRAFAGNYPETTSDIFTNVLFNHYNAPTGLCFDVRCNDDPIIDDLHSREYNIESKVQDFLNTWVIPATKGYASNNILVPMGGDFYYQYGGKFFKNMDKLIRFMNTNEFNGTKYNVLYSTPSCYLDAVRKATNGTLNAPIKTDDFFPYASSEHNFWTGYFSSRPNGKRYSRYANNFLQVCKQLSAFTNISVDDPRLNTLREAVATFQHHDAITGTEREHVAHDYIRMLHDGMVECEEVVNEALSKLVKSKNLTFTTCPMLNISECAATETAEKLILTVYNPLGKAVNKFIRLPIEDNTSNYTVRDPTGRYVVVQIVPIHPAFLKIPGRNSTAKYELVFKAQNIPGLGFKSYYYERKPSTDGNVSVTMSKKIFTTDLKKNIGFESFDIFYYNGFNGNYTSKEFSPSQPYVFRPDPNNLSTTVIWPTFEESYVGPVVVEIQRTYADWHSHIERTYIDVNDFISQYVLLTGPLPYDQQGVEPVFRFSFEGISHNGTFYTDLNGRGSIERKRDFRETWNVSLSEPVAGNYYPVGSRLYIKDNNEDVDITVYTDTPLGATSLSDGQIEFMLHRNTMSGGPGALNESLNEQAYGQGVVSLSTLVRNLRNYSNSEIYSDYFLPEERIQNMTLDAWMFLSSPSGISFEEYREKHEMEFSALKTEIPRRAHILTLEPWGPSQILLRLENFVGNDNRFAGALSLNVTDIFSIFNVTSVKETTLGANQWLENSYRMKFTQSNERVLDNAKYSYLLNPMTIRTFVLDIHY